MYEGKMLYSLIEKKEPALDGLECCKGFLTKIGGKPSRSSSLTRHGYFYPRIAIATFTTKG